MTKCIKPISENNQNNDYEQEFTIEMYENKLNQCTNPIIISDKTQKFLREKLAEYNKKIEIEFNNNLKDREQSLETGIPPFKPLTLDYFIKEGLNNDKNEKLNNKNEKLNNTNDNKNEKVNQTFTDSHNEFLYQKILMILGVNPVWTSIGFVMFLFLCLLFYSDLAQLAMIFGLSKMRLMSWLFIMRIIIVDTYTSLIFSFFICIILDWFFKLGVNPLFKLAKRKNLVNCTNDNLHNMIFRINIIFVLYLQFCCDYPYELLLDGLSDICSAGEANVRYALIFSLIQWSISKLVTFLFNKFKL